MIIPPLCPWLVRLSFQSRNTNPSHLDPQMVGAGGGSCPRVWEDIERWEHWAPITFWMLCPLIHTLWLWSKVGIPYPGRGGGHWGRVQGQPEITVSKWPAHLNLVHQLPKTMFFFLNHVAFFFYWRIVDLKCVNFCYTAKWFNYRGLVTKSCSTLGNPINSSLPGSSVHGIFQTRILEEVAISFSRGSSPLRDQTWISCIAGRLFTNWATREAWFSYAHIYSFSYSSPLWFITGYWI